MTERNSRRRVAPLLALWLGIGLTGCDSLIDVDNPNNVVGEDLLNPTAASAVANGALYTVQQGYGYMLAAYSQVSGETEWIGSRDAWFELQLGTPENPANEFTDAAFPFFAQGRWMADEAIKILVDHNANGELEDVTDLARTYLYAALAYIMIADWMDDFALSDRREAGPPIGPANMNSLYATAIGYVDQGLTIVGGSGSDLEWQLLSMRARARYSQGVWNRVGTQPISIASPLIGDAGAAADAALALAVDGGDDMTYVLDYDASTVWSDIGWQVNARLELRFSDEYIFPTADDNTRADSAQDRGIRLQDLIDPIGDPRLLEIMLGFEAGERYADLTVLSNVENHLILAEVALANSDMATFETEVNLVRGRHSLTPFVDGGAGMPTAQNLLIHERRVGLYLQGRRLNDLYRFGRQSDEWQASRAAVTNPGTFLPITKIEIDANCNISQDFSC